MEAKLKAKELVEIFIEPTKVPNIKHIWVEDIYAAKQCALILVDENIKMLKKVLDESTNVYQSLKTPKKICVDILNPLLKYWEKVREEIRSYENES